MEIEVHSQAFAGIPLLKQHRMVKSLLANEMKALHALTIRTFVPEK
jgi:stress-induced morphogen